MRGPWELSRLLDNGASVFINDAGGGYCHLRYHDPNGALIFQGVVKEEDLPVELLNAHVRAEEYRKANS